MGVHHQIERIARCGGRRENKANSAVVDDRRHDRRTRDHDVGGLKTADREGVGDTNRADWAGNRVLAANRNRKHGIIARSDNRGGADFIDIQARLRGCIQG